MKILIDAFGGDNAPNAVIDGTLDAIKEKEGFTAVLVGDKEMSVDTILIKMAQLNKRKATLDHMRKQLPKTRINQASFGNGNKAPEYRYINYDLDLVKKDYEQISNTIMQMQMALDKYNQIVEFDVEI